MTVTHLHTPYTGDDLIDDEKRLERVRAELSLQAAKIRGEAEHCSFAQTRDAFIDVANTLSDCFSDLKGTEDNIKKWDLENRRAPRIEENV